MKDHTRIEREARKYAKRYNIKLPMQLDPLFDIKAEWLNDWPNWDKPGVYCLFDSQQNILYIGKARCLGERLSAHFRYHKKRDTEGVAKYQGWKSPPRYVMTIPLQEAYDSRATS